MNNRVIHTTDELKELPVGSVVRSPCGEIWTRNTPDEVPDEVKGAERWTSDRSLWTYYEKSVGLPAKLLDPGKRMMTETISAACGCIVKVSVGMMYNHCTPVYTGINSVEIVTTCRSHKQPTARKTVSTRRS